MCKTNFAINIFASGIEDLSIFGMFHTNINVEETDSLVKSCIFILTFKLVSFVYAKSCSLLLAFSRKWYSCALYNIAEG